MEGIKIEPNGKIKTTNVLLCVGLLLLLSVLYMFTRNWMLTEDSMIYAGDITKEEWVDLFHPHHLLYSPLLKYIIVLFGRQMSPIEKLGFLQLLNIVVTVASVGVLYLILWELKKNIVLSLFGSTIYGISYGPWRYSSQIEVYNLSALLLLALLLLIISTYLKNLQIWEYILAAVLIVLVLFAHQLNVFLILSIIIAVLTWKSWGLLERIKLVSVIGIVPMIIVGCVYFILNVILYKSNSIIDTWRFATMYAQTGWWGSVQIKIG
ncbi:MAG: hypothetical protein ACP5P3_02160 [Ignavibacteria bacterium]